jgi:hypothetical protein
MAWVVRNAFSFSAVAGLVFWICARSLADGGFFGFGIVGDVVSGEGAGIDVGAERETFHMRHHYNRLVGTVIKRSPGSPAKSFELSVSSTKLCSIAFAAIHRSL